MKWLYSKIPNPKKLSPKYPKSKKFQPKFKFLWKAKLNSGGPRTKNLWKLIIPISAKLNFLSSNEMPMKLKNYYKKQPILIFAPYNFVIFLDTQLLEPKISKKTISEFFGNGVLVFSGEILGSFLLIFPPSLRPPPTVEAQNLTPPPPPTQNRTRLWLAKIHSRGS